MRRRGRTKVRGHKPKADNAFSSTVSSASSSTGASSDGVDWELRPGGMLVQRRPDSVQPSPSSGPLLKLKIAYGARQHEVSIPSEATFGELKWTLAPLTRLRPQEQRLLFRGKERDDTDYLHIAGVDDKSKIILVEDPASIEKKKEELNGDGNIAQACRDVALVREEVDKLSGEITSLKGVVAGGNKVSHSKFSSLSDMLMRQLLKLDSIEAEGQAKVLRKIEVQRIQGFTDVVDRLKAENSNPLRSNAVVVTTHWETFENGFGSLSAPRTLTPTTTMTTNWEAF